MGSVFGGGGDVQAPDYSAQIEALKAAGTQAAAAGQFKPVTVTTSFGTPQYTYDASGRLTGAGYTPAPWLQGLQTQGQNLAGAYQGLQTAALGATQPLSAANQAYGAGQNVYDYAQQAANQAQGLYGIGQEMYGLGRSVTPYAQQAYGTSGILGGLGSAAAQQAAGFQGTGQTLQGAGADIYARAAQALPTSYDTAAKTQEYYDRMQKLVAPQREQQLAKTRQGLFNTGRQGLAIGATQEGGQLATNPEMAAYYNAIAQQDLGLANQAEQQALSNLAQQTSMGQGLYNTGLAQYQAGLGAQAQGLGALTTAGGLYGQGMGALQTGAGLTSTGANILGQGIGATQAGTGQLTSAGQLYGAGTGLFGQGADLTNAYYRNITAAQAPSTLNLQNLATMETMAQSPLQLGLQFGAPATQGAQYGGTMQYNAAQSAANLGVAQEQARVAAANANAASGFWESLGGSLLSTGLSAGLTGGINSLYGGTGLFGGASKAGTGFVSGANPSSSQIEQFANFFGGGS